MKRGRFKADGRMEIRGKLSRIRVCMWRADGFAMTIVGRGAEGTRDDGTKVSRLRGDANFSFNRGGELIIVIYRCGLASKSGIGIGDHCSWDAM